MARTLFSVLRQTFFKIIELYSISCTSISLKKIGRCQVPFSCFNKNSLVNSQNSNASKKKSLVKERKDQQSSDLQFTPNKMGPWKWLKIEPNRMKL